MSGRQRARGKQKKPTALRTPRVVRAMLLLAICGLLALYIGPAHTYLSTWREMQAKDRELKQLQHDHQRLEGRVHALQNPQVLKYEARKLGLVGADERPYSVNGLPPD